MSDVTERRIKDLRTLLEALDEKIAALESSRIHETRVEEKLRLQQLVKEAREERQPLEEELSRLESSPKNGVSRRIDREEARKFGVSSVVDMDMVTGADAASVRELQARTAEALGLPVRFSDRLADSSIGPEMVIIPPGWFLMGSSEDEAGRFANEQRHEVEIKSTFAVGRYAVTFAQYDRFVKATDRRQPKKEPGFFTKLLGGEPKEGPLAMPHDHFWGRDRRPVINVSWEDAMAYCEWLSQQTGQKYRLPTEAEWEYACRAGTTTAYWWGQNISPKLANYDRANGKTLPVDTFEPNPWGLYQVHGNVWEWTASDWAENYDGSELTYSSNLASVRVVRGGGWFITPAWVRSAARDGFNARVANDNLGFRPVRSV